MRPPIRLHFYRSSSGSLNFGDELSPEVVSFVTGRPVRLAGRWTCELTGIGSILDRFLQPEGRAVTRARAVFGQTVHVWGSGIIKDRPPARHALNVLAVRGRFTRDILGAPPSTPLGDPGLIASRMIKAGSARNGIGVVPHHSDKGHAMVKSLEALPGVRVIDVERGGTEVCAEIAACSVVFSSSLHGLIIADAFGIPNRRLVFSNKLKGGDFKFLDYASALDRADIAAHSLKTPEEILTLAAADFDQSYQDRVDALCSGLESSLKSAF